MNPFEPYPYDYTEAVKKEPEFHQLQPVQQYDFNLDNLSSPQFDKVLFEAVVTDRIPKASDSGGAISNAYVIDVQTKALQDKVQGVQNPNDLVDSFNEINLESDISKLSPIFEAAYKGNQI